MRPRGVGLTRRCAFEADPPRPHSALTFQ